VRPRPAGGSARWTSAAGGAEKIVSTQAPLNPTPNDPQEPTQALTAPTANGAQAEQPTSAPEPGTMTILEHLEELRQRIIVVGVALIVGMTISAFLLTQRVMEWLVALAPAGSQVININPPEVFTAYLKVALFTGTAIAMPVLIYELFMFVLPALTRAEKRFAMAAVPGASVLFLVGIAFGYYVLIPAALGFLGGFSGGLIQPMWSIGPYLSFVTTFLFWIGVSFEMPLIIVTLAKVHVVSVAQLSHYRRYAFLAAFIIAAVITPTPDPFNQALVAIPLYLLYELGIVLARWLV
jgi:sec-independent protein translocase protein TatC